MSPGRGGRYHHGNLREELIRVTRELIAERSPQGFLISDAAKKAGVSPAAPYRHFKGKDELVSAVALEGYYRFGDALREAYEKSSGALEGFLAIGSAYLQFADKFQGEYMAMFESGLNVAGDAELTRAATYAFEPLQDAAKDLMKSLPENQRPPATMVAQHIWAMAHGVAELFARGEGNLSPFAPDELLESEMRIYLRGLGVS